ncbi:hypothetical protein CSAL01_06857 [Colletotrichum salicis]|uniref:Uncharacterized protein n=1 Tax=Colletotrichum salicis TaxID=1209931 RepID=A0A135UEJ4_9PEZI|nr:hypothetical protein CSAL01_06857 [Colletotrichum salicis]
MLLPPTLRAVRPPAETILPQGVLESHQERNLGNFPFVALSSALYFPRPGGQVFPSRLVFIRRKKTGFFLAVLLAAAELRLDTSPLLLFPPSPSAELAASTLNATHQVDLCHPR